VGGLDEVVAPPQFPGNLRFHAAHRVFQAVRGVQDITNRDGQDGRGSGRGGKVSVKGESESDDGGRSSFYLAQER